MSERLILAAAAMPFHALRIRKASGFLKGRPRFCPHSAVRSRRSGV